MRFFRSVGVLLIIILAFTAFSAFDCGDGKAIINVSISPSTAVILTFDPPNSTSQTFTAYVTFDDNTGENTTDKVEWESANTSIAAFTDNVLNPVAVGTTQVRATAEKGTVMSGWIPVTVRPPFAVLGGTASANDDTLDIDDDTTLTMIASIDTDDDQVQDDTENVTSITTWTVNTGNSTGTGTISGNTFTATGAGTVQVDGSFDSDDVSLSSAITDSVTITILPPVSVALSASPTTVTFSGTAATTVNLTAVPSGGTPDGYTWTTTAGTLGATSTTTATNTLDLDWQNAGATVTIGVTADFQGVDSADDTQVSVASAVGPTFSSITVNGSGVADGASAGEFSAGESLAVVASATDADGGTVSYSWSGTNGAVVNPTTGASVSVSQANPDTTSTITCTITDNNGGASSQRTFTFDATLAAAGTDEMRLRSVTPDNAGEIKILMETGPMSTARLGVTVEIAYDGAKVSAGGGDGETHDDNPWGSGLELYFPNLNPSNMTYSGFSATTDGGAVFTITYGVDSGSGSTTDFTFVQANSLYANPDGTTFAAAATYTDATGVAVP